MAARHFCLVTDTFNESNPDDPITRDVVAVAQGIRPGATLEDLEFKQARLDTYDLEGMIFSVTVISMMVRLVKPQQEHSNPWSQLLSLRVQAIFFEEPNRNP